jgi:hypothetical protein
MEQRILARIGRDFQKTDQKCVTELLASYSGPESDRIRWDVLELSKGSVGKVGEYLKAAESDYRDVLIGPSIIRMIRCCVIGIQKSWWTKSCPNGGKKNEGFCAAAGDRVDRVFDDI